MSPEENCGRADRAQLGASASAGRVTSPAAGSRGEVRPFPTDPGVMARIFRMRREHVREVAGLHAAAMGNSLWAQLGRGFLETLYEGLLKSPRFIAFVYVEEGSTRGFIAGSSDSGRMFRDVLGQCWLSLGICAVRGVLRRPRLLISLLATPLYWRRSTVDADTAQITAESLFCSFRSDLRGTRVSGHINKVLFDELAWRGHARVKITTEVDNAGAVRQLTAWGFEDRGEFGFYGKRMRTYVLDLLGSPRVHPAEFDEERAGRSHPRHE